MRLKHLCPSCGKPFENRFKEAAEVNKLPSVNGGGFTDTLVCAGCYREIAQMFDYSKKTPTDGCSICGETPSNFLVKIHKIGKTPIMQFVCRNHLLEINEKVFKKYNEMEESQ